MSNIYKETFALLDKFGLSAKKKFGQNFLIDQNVLNNIVEKSEVQDEDLIIEVGPGLGNLTKVIASTGKPVVAYEIDDDMIEVLKYSLRDFDNVNVIHEDILNADLSIYKGKKVCVIANLPYYITTAILFKFLESDIDVSFFTLMMQREVADRMCGKTNTKDYNALSVILQYKGKVNMLFPVSKEVFTPKPNVDSAVIKLSLEEAKLNKEDEIKFIKLVKNSFTQRRKTLVNNLSLAYPLSKLELAELLKELGFNETVRAESLSVDDFIKLSTLVDNVLSSK